MTRSGLYAFVLSSVLFVVGSANSLADTAAVAIAESTANDSEEMQLLMRLAKRNRTSRSVDVIVDAGGHPSLGDKDAEIVLMEFSDFQCAFCRRHLNSVMPELLKEFIEPGDVEYVFLDYPVEERHPRAFKAAVAARCANEQDKYWEIRKRLYISSAMLTAFEIQEHAKAVGLDLGDFHACLESDRYRVAIGKDKATALRLRVRGTPTFFVGTRETGTDRVKLVQSIIGYQSIEIFRDHLNEVAASVAR